MRNLHRLVNERMKEVLPQFMPGFTYSVFSKDVPKVEAFTKKHSESLYFHVVPTIVPLQNYFTCHLCVMRSDRSPIHSFIGSPESNIDEFSPELDGMQFSVSLLWTDFPLIWMLCEDASQVGLDDVAIMMPPSDARLWIVQHADLYGSVLDEDQTLVWPLVDDMVLRIAKFGGKYFEEIGDHYA